jgi:hypothetical protein
MKFLIKDDYEEEKPKAKLDITPTSDNVRDPTYKEKIEKKVRDQARRLLELQSYKNLCEQRILQLIPSHPLPILSSHLQEQAKAESNEIVNMKCIIDTKDKVIIQLN